MLMETRSTSDWISNLIDKLENIIASGGKITWSDELGSKITTSIGKNIVTLLKENYAHLAKISINAFKDFLDLMHKQKDFDALVVIYRELDTTELVNRYKEDTVKLAEIARQAQEERDFWIWFGKQFATRVLFGAISALI